MAVENNECGAPFRLAKNIERMVDTIDVVRIANPQDVPTIGEEPGCNIFGERNTRIAFDRDVIVVVNPAQIIEPEMSGQGCSLRCNTLHQATIPTDGMNVVIEDLETRPIIAVGEPLLR